MVKLVTSVLQNGSYLLRNSLVQSGARDVSAGSGVEEDWLYTNVRQMTILPELVFPLSNLFFVMTVEGVSKGLEI